jgi:hypothetical protein
MQDDRKALSRVGADARPDGQVQDPGRLQARGRYVVVYRAGGRQVKESARMYDEARRLKSRRQADVEAGEFDGRSRVTFHQYAREWADRYQGNGRRGFREHTREEYRRLLECFALRFFPSGCDWSI